MVGSSPLTRGTFREALHQGHAVRLIPAHAGNTSVRLLVLAAPWAHPRASGEHWRFWVPSTLPSGSSPLARGTLRICQICRSRIRLIPAHAGNIVPASRSIFSLAAHPRSRREHEVSLRDDRAELGSSPLTQGTRRLLPSRLWDTGLIPAHAGNTWERTDGDITVTAHPRSRREHTC